MGSNQSVDCTRVILNESYEGKNGAMLPPYMGAAMLATLSLIYIPIMVCIWKNRRKQAVHFKSPNMILIGGIGMYLDASCNVIASMQTNSKIICYQSLFLNIVFHYIGYFALIFRARRIAKVMKLESKYLDRIYKLTKSNLNNSSNTNATSTNPSVVDSRP